MSLQEVYQLLKPELQRMEKLLDRAFAKSDGLGRKLYLQQAKFRGKRLRPALLFLAARTVGKVKPIHADLALIVELLHNATLIHDDVLDDAKIRRYLPTINQHWGNEMAILFGDLVLSNAFQACARVKSPEVIKILSETAYRMCYGELRHTAGKFDPDLTEETYLKIIEDKTASLFATACYLGAHFATTDKKQHAALKSYGLNFGMAYQIIDDHLDCTSEERLMGKTAGTDLIKGKMTLPLIRLKQVLPSRRRHIFSSSLPVRVTTLNRQKEIKRLLQTYGISADILKSAEAYLKKAAAALSALPHSRPRRFLEIFANSFLPEIT